MMDLERPYIIGETAYLHEGDFDYLKRMVKEIAEIELDAVKFHLLHEPTSYMQKKHPLIDSLEDWSFTEEEWDNIFDLSSSLGLDIIALCDDVESLEYVLEKRSEIMAIELHATGLNDHFLLEAASKFKGLVILGIGGSSQDEVHYAIEFLQARGVKDILLMYGFQSYPTDYSDINLSKMIKIKELFELPVGYADHTAYDDPHNEVISIMGASLGVPILEKHFTPEYGVERIDFHAAVGKEQMLRIKKLMNLAFEVYGSGKMTMSEPEKKYGNVGPMKKAVVARVPIKAGETLTLDKLWFKRTEEESTLMQNQFLLLVGQKAKVDIEEDEVIDLGKVDYKFENASLEEFTHVRTKES